MTTLHDYTKRGWGHDFHITSYSEDGKTLKLVGWGQGLKEEDEICILHTNGINRITYKINTVSYYKDPIDMWVATVSFIGVV